MFITSVFQLLQCHVTCVSAFTACPCKTAQNSLWKSALYTRTFGFTHCNRRSERCPSELHNTVFQLLDMTAQQNLYLSTFCFSFTHIQTRALSRVNPCYITESTPDFSRQNAKHHYDFFNVSIYTHVWNLHACLERVTIAFFRMQ